MGHPEAKLARRQHGSSTVLLPLMEAVVLLPLIVLLLPLTVPPLPLLLLPLLLMAVLVLTVVGNGAHLPGGTGPGPRPRPSPGSEG